MNNIPKKANRRRLNVELCILVGTLLPLFGLIVLGIFSEGRSPTWETWRLILIGFSLILIAMLIFLWYLPLQKLRKSILALQNDLETPDYNQVLKRIRYYHPLGEEFSALIQQIDSQKQREYVSEMLRKEAELAAMQSQINPHFLYNTLDSIRGQLLFEGQKQIADTLESLSSLFRYSTNPKTVYNTFSQEIDNIENYMRIIRYRFGDRVALHYIIDEADMSIYNCEIPKLTLQPIVENAILHGLELKKQGGIITVRAWLSMNELNICVEDNGVGMSEEQLADMNRRFASGMSEMLERGSGIALLNVNERIRLRYGPGYGIKVYSALQLGTQVCITLPRYGER